MALVTLDEAKNHLHIELENTDHDDDLDLKREAASAILLDYLKVSEDYWQDSNSAPVSPPYLIRAATLLILGALFENREGNPAGQGVAEPLSQAVKDLVHRYRDPALA